MGEVEEEARRSENARYAGKGRGNVVKLPGNFGKTEKLISSC